MMLFDEQIMINLCEEMGIELVDKGETGKPFLGDKEMFEPITEELFAFHLATTFNEMKNNNNFFSLEGDSLLAS